MVLALISIILLLMLVLLAIRIGLNKQHTTEEIVENPIIYASGIYSILKKSPMEGISKHKPPEEDIRQYLQALNEDSEGRPLSDNDKKQLIEGWMKSIDETIATIELGDKTGVEFYYYDFLPAACPICKGFISKGKFVTREEIYSYPAIMPPLHLGCSAKLFPHRGKENLRETTEMGLLPLFKKQTTPPLPDWKSTTKINVT